MFPITDKHYSITFLGPNLSETNKKDLQALHRICSNYFFKNDSALSERLITKDANELNSLLEHFIFEIFNEGKDNPIQALDHLSKLIPLESLQKSLKIADPLKEVQKLASNAKYYFEINKKNFAETLKNALSVFLDGLISLIDSIVAAFGIADVFRPAESDIHADFKTQKIMMILSLFTMLTTVILPIVGATTGAIAIGIAFLSIAALSIIWQFIKPKPIKLPGNAENFSITTKDDQDFVLFGIEESLNEIVEVIDSGLHPLLVGESGVGKSLRAKALAVAFREGKLFPHHKNKTLHRINTADLLKYQPSFLGGNDIIYKFRSSMGRHYKEMLPVFDEIHMACVDNGELANQLKTALEKGGFLPCVIGITTKEEYDKYFTGQTAFSNRFKKVEIKNTDREETLAILSYRILRSPHDPLVDEGALTHLYEASLKSKNDIATPQPKSALTLLDKCFSLTKRKLQSPLESDIFRISSKIAGLRAVSLIGNQQVSAQMQTLENELQVAKSKLKIEKSELNRLYKNKDLLRKFTDVKYQTILNITKGSPDNKNIVRFLLLNFFFNRVLLNYIKQKAEILKVDIVISKQLIEKAIAQ